MGSALQYINVSSQDLRSSEIEFRRSCRSREGACSRRSAKGNTTRSWRRGIDGGCAASWCLLMYERRQIDPDLIDVEPEQEPMDLHRA
ncbi:hypothetical protein ACFX2J_002407 [Malus domestica]